MKFCSSFLIILYICFCASCADDQNSQTEIRLVVKQLVPEESIRLSKEIRSKVAAVVDSSLVLSLWASDSLVADPIALDMDDEGRVYITRTNRQLNSEFDIRGHQDWEIGSIMLQTPEDRRAFLKRELSPDSSEVNDWFVDLNGDGSRDWKDLTVEKEQVFRIEDVDGDGIADRSQLLIEGFNDVITDCNGALEIFEDNVFMGVGPDMWRLQDEDGDGYAEKKTSISNGYNVHIGFGAHGMSGAEIGPDGRLYWGIGDVGFNGVGPDGKEWKYPNRGVIVRSELDGSNFEVFAMGLRNTHEFVFDKYANLISEDNDGDHPGESERLVYIVEGSDTGWRISWQFGKYNDPKNNTYKVWMDERLNVPRWDGQAAHITPCIRNYVNGPTGMLYNPGTALSEQWKDHFFIVEFVGNATRSGIHAFTLEPKGASFGFGKGKQILSGVLPTGIDWGPDGAMYAGDWIEGWGTKKYGRVWKLDDILGQQWSDRQSTASWIKADFTKQDVDQLYELLHHPDMRIRQKAQFEIVKRGDIGYDILKKAAHQKEHQLARVHGIIGMAQMARTQGIEYAQGIVGFLEDEDSEIRAQAAKWIGDVKYNEAGSQLISLLADEAPRVRFFAAEALGRTANADASQALIEMLLQNDDQDAYLRHAGSLALARIGDGALLARLSDHPSRALRLAAVVALRRMEDPGVANFLNDDDILVVRDAARAINDDWSIESALEDLAKLLNVTPFKEDEPIVRRCINANLRVGNDQSLERLMNFATNEVNPRSMRVEALETIQHWSSPSVLDRVDGRYRGSINRSISKLKSVVEDDVIALLENKSPTIQRSAARVIGANQMQSAVAILKRLLRTSKGGTTRRAMINALIAVDAPDIDEDLAIALADKKQEVRVAALTACKAANISESSKLALLRNVIFDKTISERQSAIMALAALSSSTTRSTFEELLDQWSSDELDREVRLDLADAIEEQGDTELIKRLNKIQVEIQEGDVMASYSDCLSGGDGGRGSQIIWNHTGAQCIRCHEMYDYGGIAGPALTTIGDELSPREILESLINPSAKIATGYGMVTLIMNDDSEIDGMLLFEDDELLRIRDADDNILEIQRNQISERIDAVSSMPDMTKVLTKKEIRDVVAFLTTLKKSTS